MKKKIPQVGDTVEITKSTINWNSEGLMDGFVGLRLKIESIGPNGSRAKFRNAPKGMNDWIWNFTEKHFKLVEEEPEFIFHI